MTEIDQMDEEYLPVTAAQAWLWMKELEVQFTDADRSRPATAEAFWAEHPDSLRLAANWCTPWDCIFNLWFHARKIWQHYVDTTVPLIVWADLVRAIEARNDGEYGLIHEAEKSECESVLEECVWETADVDLRARIHGALEDLRHNLELVPGVDSVAIGPSLNIGEVKEYVSICRMTDDDDWLQDVAMAGIPS